MFINFSHMTVDNLLSAHLLQVHGGLKVVSCASVLGDTSSGGLCILPMP